MPDEVDAQKLEEAFNLLVSLARNTKMTYEGHAQVDKAINLVHEALNSNSGPPEPVVTHINDKEQ